MDTGYLPPAPGGLRLIPAGETAVSEAGRRCHLLVGDATARPIHTIHIAPQVNLSPLPNRGRKRLFRLKILHFNDLHGHISRLTRHGERPIFSRLVGRWRCLRARYQHDPDTAVLFLSAGDDTVGSVFDELLGSTPDQFIHHAAYHLYSAAELDAAAVGNHDLDLGTHMLAHAIRREARFPLLCANLIAPPALRRRIHPAAILSRKGIRVGVIGLTTPGQNKGETEPGLRLTDPVRAVRHLLPALRPYCHVLILLSHLGYRSGAQTASVSGAGDVELAEALPSGAVDLIIGGHSHHALNEDGLHLTNVVNGIAIVQAGALGRFLGEVTLTLNGQTAVSNAHLTPTADLPLDEEFEERVVQPLLRRVRPHFHRPLGRVIDHSDLSPEAVENDFAAGESALANFISDALLVRVRAHGLAADFAMIDASVVKTGLAAGPLTFADWFALMPYADTIRLCHLNGRQLLALLHDNARCADRPDEPHIERGFLHFSQAIRYTIQAGPSRATARAAAITVDGDELATKLDKGYTAVVPSFLRRLARPWRSQARQAGISLVDERRWHYEDTGLFLRPELVAHLVAHGGVTASGGAHRDGRVRVVFPAPYSLFSPSVPITETA